MKYLTIVLGLFACHFSPEQPAVTASVEQPASALAAPADSLVPPQFDANQRLIRLNLSNGEWKKRLNELEYYVLRDEGTERAFTGDLWKNHEQGTYICRGCGLPLFASETKFESGTGWPSFWKPIKPEYVAEKSDNSFGMTRTEVECARCGGHLGHVFDDGPRPTGLRYCMNSASLDFIKQ